MVGTYVIATLAADILKSALAVRIPYPTRYGNPCSIEIFPVTTSSPSVVAGAECSPAVEYHPFDAFRTVQFHISLHRSTPDHACIVYAAISYTIGRSVRR